ncbi:hypothetical protein FRC09_014751 [Ceratobasidium sp. 395]|nr:hypothetical protein FRC09_014751 [Ceratobasidium sp. 395]
MSACRRSRWNTPRREVTCGVPSAFSFPHVDHLTAARIQIIRVNTTGFFVAVPYVWSHVGNVKNLLILFPPAVAGLGSNLNSSINSQPAALDFSRLQLYAPYVKSIEIHRTNSLVTSNWSVLNSALDQRPLLPNLQSLAIHGPRPRVQLYVPLYVDWISWFASPSLTSFVFVSLEEGLDIDHPTPPLEVSIILQAILEGRPELERLVLPHCSSRLGVESEHATKLLGRWQAQAPEQYLRQLHSLRELEGSMVLLTLSFLQVISCLPRLQSLRLYSANREPIPARFKLGPDAFSILRSLAFINFNEPEVTAALDVISVLPQLTLLELNLRYEVNEDWVVTALFPRLEQMTYLSVFLFDFDSIWPEGAYGFDSPTALNVLSRLPLERVKLGSIAFDEAESLAAMFPIVKRLEVPNSNTSLHSLTALASMSSLERLRIPLTLPKDSAPYRHTIPCSPAFHTLELSSITGAPFDKELLLRASRTLLDIWPNLCQIVSFAPGWNQEMDHIINSFNACLLLMRNIGSVGTQTADK